MTHDGQDEARRDTCHAGRPSQEGHPTPADRSPSTADTAPHAGVPGDERVDQAIRAAFASERMPAGLKASTLAFIHARAEASATGAVNAGAAADARPDAAISTARVGAVTPDDAVTQAPSPAAARRTRRRQDAPRQKSRTTAGARGLMTRRRAVATLAACAGVALFGFGGVSLAAETSSVELGDVRTVSLGVNRWDHVVRAESPDRQLARELTACQVKGAPIDRALAAIASNDVIAQALVEGGEMAVTTQGNAQQCASIESSCSDTLSSTLGVGMMACSPAYREEARANGMGVGRYRVFQQIQAIDPSVTASDCQSMSMRQLRDLLERVSADDDDDAAMAPDDAMTGGAMRMHGHGMGMSGGHRAGWRHSSMSDVSDASAT